MQFSEALGLMKGMKGTPVLLGPPGIGKTALGIQLAAHLTEERRKVDPNAEEAICEVRDLTSTLPEDIGGLPRVGDTTTYSPPDWLYRCCQEGAYGVLVLDDLPACSPSVQAAVRQLVLFRRVHGFELSDDIRIVVTGNRREDKSGASTLPAHFRNSVVMLQLTPNLEEWSKWYGEQEGLEPSIPSFIRFRPSHFSKLPKDACPELGSFATPRSWARLGKEFANAKAAGLLKEVADGCVGSGVGTEYVAFLRTRSELVDPFKVLRQPQTALPNPGSTLAQIDRMVAMVTGLAEVAAAHQKAEDWEEVGNDRPIEAAFFEALGWVCRSAKEHVATGVAVFVGNGGNFAKVVTVLSMEMQAGTLSPEGEDLLDFVHKNLE